ncbi:MAG: diaminopimelate decarboxylase [Fimbriimonadaceae bacterium]|nr:diaminopimelate decarboxylase [Fimbriimonadaceae bacterium]
MLSSPRLDTRFRLSEPVARALAAEFGTPLYVLDERHFRARIRAYRSALEASYPRTEVAFASKANGTLAVLAIAHAEGCLVDVASEGELRGALAAGVPASRCHLHGNNKSLGELRFALASGIGQIVIDHFGEIEAVHTLARELGVRPECVLRLAPGVDPVTHHKISTGQADTKFGFNIADGSAERALARCLELGLDVAGFHCHVGSQLLDPEAQRSGGETLARFAARMKAELKYETRTLNVGGGLGVRYLDDHEPMDVQPYCQLVAGAVRAGLEGSGLEPLLVHEPGRSLVAESGVTLYTVGVVKTVPIGEGRTRTYAGVDGGLSENPRPALYGAKYTVERVARTPDRPGVALPEAPFTVSGKHCETDQLFEDVSLPADLAAGDLLQVLCTGAYNASMASNYNRYPRPATVLLRPDGTRTVVQRRDAWDEMFARETVPDDLESPA